MTVAFYFRVRVRLKVRFTINMGRKVWNLAGVRSIQAKGVCLIWRTLNIGFHCNNIRQINPLQTSAQSILNYIYVILVIPLEEQLYSF